LVIAKSDSGFNLLRNAMKQMRPKKEFNKFVQFLLSSKTVTRESLFELVYKENEDASTILGHFVLAWVELVDGSPSLSKANILEDIFIGFIDKGKDVGLIGIIEINNKIGKQGIIPIIKFNYT
jgi:hypothetical protein